MTSTFSHGTRPTSAMMGHDIVYELLDSRHLFETVVETYR